MADDNNNKNPNEKQPGEKPEGTYHYNPGNQSGKGAVHREGDEADNTKAAQSDDKRK